MNKFLGAVAAFLLATLVLPGADKVLYENNFAAGFKNNANLQVMPVNGLPGVGQGLMLKTYKRPDGKLSYRGWSHTLKLSGYECITVDYAILAVSPATRYALFVTSRGAMPVSAIIDNGKLKINSHGMGWHAVAPIRYGTWHRIRYVIRPGVGNFDVYVNDMTRPAAKELKFRTNTTPIFTGIWIEGSETEPSETMLADIKITGSGFCGILPEAFAASPHFIGVAMRTAIPPAIDGRGGSGVWEKARKIPLNAERELQEKSEIRFLYDDNNLYCLFRAAAPNQRTRKAEFSGDDVKAYRDDSVELFLDPGRSERRYFHCVTNSGSGRYDARCGDDFKDKNWNSNWRVKTFAGDDFWSAEMAIPFAALGGSAPQAGDLWGVNAGRVNPFAKEIGAWRPLTNFHDPGMFAKLVFADPEYLQRSAAEALPALGEKSFKVQEKISEVKKLLAENSAMDAKRTLALTQEMRRIGAILTNPAGYPELTEGVAQLESLRDKAIKQKSDLVRLTRFFAPGSPGEKRGFVICVESSMIKVPQNNYAGTSAAKAELTLAGRESGSFQLVLIGRNGVALPEISVKATALAVGGTTLPLEICKVENIATVQRTKQSVSYPDALIPAEKMAWKSTENTGIVWCDVTAPPDAKPGIYRSKITVGSKRGDVVVPLEVQVLPFTLPLKSSLPNAFCFDPSWAAMYYGREATAAERQRYFEFLLAHRLDPMNLWGNTLHDLTVEELERTEKLGKSFLFIPINRLRGNEKYYRELLSRFNGRLKPYFFGHDEVLMQASIRNGVVEAMQRDYAYAKKTMPHVRRLNTSHIDEQLYGYVDAWCPLFSHFGSKIAAERQAKGEEVWWYPTDYPLAPYANFNLDSPGIDPRIIPWMNWKLQIDGLLYWGINREWVTQVKELSYLSDEEIKILNLTFDVNARTRKLFQGGVRWPELRWLPYFRAIHNSKAPVSQTNGGGNLMYPGPDFVPYASIRLKNLRDGMQDYEYLAMLRSRVEELAKKRGDAALIERGRAVLRLSDDVVGSATRYTKNPEVLLREKNRISELIVAIDTALEKVKK